MTMNKYVIVIYQPYKLLGSWLFTSAMNVGSLYLKAFSLLQMNLGQQGFVAVLKTEKVVS
jgi:hypothetical protein